MAAAAKKSAPAPAPAKPAATKGPPSPAPKGPPAKAQPLRAQPIPAKAAPAPAPEVQEAKAPRASVATMTPEQKLEAVTTLIHDLYSGTLDAKSKSNTRAKLRNIDHDWRITYADIVAQVKPQAPVAEEGAEEGADEE